VATAEQRRAFSTALQEALDGARISGRELARRLNLSQAGVQQWLRGKTAPRPATVARVEQLLEQEPGTLARVLGYTVIKQVSDGRVFNVTEAINAEPRLGPREKALLLSMYRELLRQAKSGDDAAARAKD
jgi:transcriptional regulator with XRE-family HTH domain